MLAEFWMIEPEIAFYDLKKVINFATKLLKNVIKNTIKKHPKEFDYLQNNVDETLLERLNTFIKKKLMVLDYKDALVELEKVKDRFENQDINFGLDFATEHEKYLAEEIAHGPIAIINFPKSFKAFYMYQNDDDKTVADFWFISSWNRWINRR
nr:amino acid--tRNA ligase-related protein [Mycoplasmopsis bovis]